MQQPSSSGGSAVVPACIAPEDHCRLISYCARRYKTAAHAVGMEVTDLEQEGWLGLMKACRAYNPERGPFGPFATVVITQRMRQALSEYERLRQLPDFGPGETEEPVSREEPDPDATLDVQRLLAGLPPRERRAVELRFGLGDGEERTLEEVAGELQITKQRAHQVLRAALNKLVRAVGHTWR